MNREDVIQSLVELYAEEVEAALRYLHMSLTLEGPDREMKRDQVLTAMQETLAHAQVVARKAKELGTVPHLKLRIDFDGERLSGEQALEQAVAFETAARDAYAELVEKAAGEPDLQEFARAQVRLEETHVAELKALLDS